MLNFTIFYLFITVNKLDYDQIMSKLQYVCSKVDGKMNAGEIVESVNLFMAIEWGNYKLALKELNVQLNLKETCIYNKSRYLPNCEALR